MPAAYLYASSPAAPATFCSLVPFDTRREAATALRRSLKQTNGQIYKCDDCHKWHIQPSRDNGKVRNG